MNILAMQVGRDGCSGYRVRNPIKALKKIKGHQVFMLDGKETADEMLELVNGADAIIFRQNHIKVFNFIKENIDVSSKILVVDIDDDIFNTSPFAPEYRFGGTEEIEWQGKKLWEDGKNGFDIKRNKKSLAATIEMLKQADLITCTTPYLNNTLYKTTKNKSIAVLPNAIDKHWKKWNFKENKEEIRIGWTGGSTHYIDWHTIIEPLKRIFKKNKGLKLVLQGCKWDGTIKDIPHEFHNWIDFEGHPYKTASLNIDIAIIPLADNDFNRSKSCIKWYEFSSLGIPSVIADVKPYSLEINDKNSMPFNNEDELEKGLQKLIDDKELRDKIGKNAKKWVGKNRKLEDIAKNYIKVYQNALDDKRKV